MKRALLLAFLCASAVSRASASVVIVTSPGSSTVASGQQFDVVIQVQPGGQQIDAAQAYVDFDATKLQVVSITNGALTQVQNVFNNSTGTLGFAGFTLSSFPTSTFTLCTVRFSAIATTASTALTFASSPPRRTDATFGGSSVFTSATNGTVTVNAATPTLTPTLTPAVSATPSPGAGTPTAIAIPGCCADYDHDGYVSSSEVQICATAAAGFIAVNLVPQCDCDGNGVVNGNDLSLANQAQSNGCPGTVSSSLPLRAINPVDSDVLVSNHLVCRGSTTRPCLNSTAHSVQPGNLRQGDMWLKDDGSSMYWCAFSNNRTRCVSMAATP